MFDEIEIPKKQSGFKALEFMSVNEIEEYIDELKAEIIKAEQDIQNKKASAEAANSIFK